MHCKGKRAFPIEVQDYENILCDVNILANGEYRAIDIRAPDDAKKNCCSCHMKKTCQHKF